MWNFRVQQSNQRAIKIDNTRELHPKTAHWASTRGKPVIEIDSISSGLLQSPHCLKSIDIIPTSNSRGAVASAAESRPSQNPIICPGNIFFAILSTPWSGARDYFWPALLCAKRLRICHNKCFSMIKFWTVTIQFVSVRACVRRYARTLACKHDTNQSLIGLTIVWCGSLICDEILVWNCTFLNIL